jgi:hypothetical protein
MLLICCPVILGFATPLMEGGGLITVVNWMVVAGTLVSTTFFLSFRLLFYRSIFCSVKLSEKAVNR